MQEVIGKVSFGVTYMGTYDQTKVAFKCMRIESDVEANSYGRPALSLS